MTTSSSITTALICFIALTVAGIAFPMFNGAFSSPDLFLMDTQPYWQLDQSIVKVCVYIVLICAALTTRLLMRLNKLGIYTLTLGSASATTAILATIQEPLWAFATMIIATVGVIKVFEASRKGDFGDADSEAGSLDKQENE